MSIFAKGKNLLPCPGFPFLFQNYGLCYLCQQKGMKGTKSERSLRTDLSKKHSFQTFIGGGGAGGGAWRRSPASGPAEPGVAVAAAAGEAAAVAASDGDSKCGPAVGRGPGPRPALQAPGRSPGSRWGRPTPSPTPGWSLLPKPPHLKRKRCLFPLSKTQA